MQVLRSICGLLGLAILAFSALAETDYSDLLQSKYISLGANFKPAALRESTLFNTNYNEDQADNKKYLIETNAKSPLKYKLKVNVTEQKRTMDEVTQWTEAGANTAGDSRTQILSTIQFDSKSALLSSTICEGQHDTYFWQLQDRSVHSCVTITPKLCQVLKGLSKTPDFKELMDSAQACSDLTEKLRKKLSGAFDDDYKKTEASNIERLKLLSKEVSPSTTANAVFYGYGDEQLNPLGVGDGHKLLEKKSSASFRKGTTRRAFAMFDHLNRAAHECVSKEKYFEGPAVAPAPAPAKDIKADGTAI